MKPLAAANRFMELFFSGSKEDIARLESILAPDLTFQGPFLQSETAREYIEALLADPPRGMTFEILEAIESDTSSCLIYDLQKEGVTTTIAQYFGLRDGVIAKIILVFDTSAFVD